MNKEEIYLDLSEACKPEKQKRKQSKKGTNSPFILLFVAIISLIGIFIYTTTNNQKNSLEIKKNLEENNQKLTKEITTAKSKLNQMKEKIEQKDSEIKIVTKKMKQMQTEMDKLETEVNDLQKSNLEENMELIKGNKVQKENNIQDTIKENDEDSNIKKIEKEKEKNEKIDTKILNNLEELQFIENRLAIDHVGKKANFKLLFRGSSDGTKSTIFHKKCDNIKGTLILIKTNDGLKLGGYTEALWNHLEEHEYRDDKYAFVFNIKNKKIFNSNGKRSIFSNKNYGPVFGDGIIEIYSNFFVHGGITVDDSNYNYKNKELTEGKFKIDVEEIEVFQVTFE